MLDRPPPIEVVEPLDVLDVALGVVAAALTAVLTARTALRRVEPAGLVLLRPRFLPEPLWPATVLASMLRPVATQGRRWRDRVALLADQRLDRLVPAALDATMGRLQPTETIRRYVDLDEVATQIDIDAIAARLDIDAVLDRVDLDAVVARLDVEAVVARVDLDQAAARLDIDAVLDRLDLTATVLQRVDLAAVVDAVLAQVDVPVLVEAVLDEIDLPGIIRESTGTMASDTVRGVRMQGVSADEAVGRVVDRLLLRHRRVASDGAT
jgi:hypothetical protein